ncbi:MAG: SPOR domain-containing protein [Alphaproteobacteria bacterium]|nr:SPOR domain-containing protein [Alphaproteobacteria bacterium]MBN2779787.1 SPOR domain-containing protein [Alphaproteobacteria bacterium]
MTEKSFFEELDKKLGHDDDNDFSYKSNMPEQNGKGFPVVLVVLAVVFVAVVVVLFSELLSRGEKANEATMPESAMEQTIGSDELSDEDVENAQKALEAAEEEDNVKPAVEGEDREVPAPKIEKKVKQIKAPSKIRTGDESTSSKKTPVVKKATVVPSGWQVQLAAVSSYQSAEKEWKRLKGSHPVLANQQYAIIEKEVNGKMLYRLRVVGMGSRDVADKLCADLQTQKVSCLVME